MKKAIIATFAACLTVFATAQSDIAPQTNMESAILLPIATL